MLHHYYYSIPNDLKEIPPQTICFVLELNLNRNQD